MQATQAWGNKKYHLEQLVAGGPLEPVPKAISIAFHTSS